jgi:hypothetical protein
MKMVEAEVAQQVGISVPGLVSIIVHDGEMVLSQGWGDADIESG